MSGDANEYMPMSQAEVIGNARWVNSGDIMKIDPTVEAQFAMAILTGLCANPNLMSRNEFEMISGGEKGGIHFIRVATALSSLMMKEREK